MKKTSRKAATDAAAQLARSFWSRRYGRILSPEEADEIRSRMLAFFNLLRAWDEEASSRPALKALDTGPGNDA